MVICTGNRALAFVLFLHPPKVNPEGGKKEEYHYKIMYPTALLIEIHPHILIHPH